MTSGTQLLSGLSPLFAYAVQYLDAYAKYYGLTNWRIVSAYRSQEEQARLYAKGRTPTEVQLQVKKQGRGGAVTDAPPGSSAHNWGLAVDGEGPDWPRVRELAVKLGFGTISWDHPHLQWPGWERWVP